MSRPIQSHVVRSVIGHLGESKHAGEVRMMREDAFSKCETCGATLMTYLCFQLHTSGTGVCILVRRSTHASKQNWLDSL